MSDKVFNAIQEWLAGVLPGWHHKDGAFCAYLDDGVTVVSLWQKDGYAYHGRISPGRWVPLHRISLSNGVKEVRTSGDFAWNPDHSVEDVWVAHA